MEAPITKIMERVVRIAHIELDLRCILFSFVMERLVTLSLIVFSSSFIPINLYKIRLYCLVINRIPKESDTQLLLYLISIGRDICGVGKDRECVLQFSKTSLSGLLQDQTIMKLLISIAILPPSLNNMLSTSKRNTIYKR